MSFGFLMKLWNAGMATVEAKSGRVSRSRNWAMFFAWLTSSADFFCRAVYWLVSAPLFAEMNGS